MAVFVFSAMLLICPGFATCQPATGLPDLVRKQQADSQLNSLNRRPSIGNAAGPTDSPLMAVLTRQPPFCFLSDPQMATRGQEQALALARAGQYSAAAEKFNYVIREARKKKFFDVEIRTMVNLGLMYDAQERYIDMRDVLYEALQKALQLNMADEVALARGNLAIAEARLNNYGVCIEYNLLVIPYYQSVSKLDALGCVYAHLGNAYWQVKKYNEALVVLQKALHIRSRLNDQSGLLNIYLNLARVHLDMLAYDSATIYADKCVKEGIRLGLINDLKDVYKIKADVAARRNDYTAAFKLMQQHSVWKDSSYKLDRDKISRQQALIFKANYTDSILLVKNKEISVQRSYKQGFALVALIVLICAGLLWRKEKDLRQRIASLKKEMEEARPATETISNPLQEEMVEKMQLLNKEVFELKQQLNRQVQMDIDQLKGKLLSTIDKQETYWNEFLLFFSKIYPDFFERLKKQFPELTQNELRISALMKLNLGTQDMANVLNITIESVRKARYRIYKKMNLTSDQEFADFMLMY
jgi:DNA-binding CsgD family transcriptional regulator